MGGPRRPASAPGGLPVLLTRLCGRDREIAELRDILVRARLLTLVGAPGCGKTRLAAEVAAQMAPTLADGVRFVDLGVLTDPALVPQTVATAMGILDTPGQRMEDRLTELLAESRFLLLLDNCEHLVDAAADLAQHLLAGCPSSAVLATSRTALGLAGEHVWTVPPLDRTSAEELFVDRARLAANEFELDAAGTAEIQEICGRLDGLPLAIELTAAWTRVLSVGQIAERLLAAPASLTNRARNDTPRHETMVTTVDWSYQMLPAAPQRLFEQLSVFAGDFDLTAAETVVGPEVPDVLAHLTVLVDHGLVAATAAQGEPMRYRLLEPIRQCASARLDRDRRRAETVKRRHLHYYLELANRYDPFGVREIASAIPFREVEQNEGNLLAALGWARAHDADLALRLCDALAPFWEAGGRAIGRRWLDEQLAVGGTADPRMRTRALTSAGRLAWRHGDYRQALVRMEQAVAVGQRFDRDKRTAAALSGLGLVTMSCGDVEAAFRHCQASIDLGLAVGAPLAAAYGWIILGWAHYVKGDVTAGDQQFHNAEAINHRRHPTVTAHVHFGLHFGALLVCDVRARRHHLTATFAAMEDGGMLEVADWLSSCTLLAHTEGRLHAAAQLYGGTEALRRRRGSRPAAAVDAMTADLVEAMPREVGTAVYNRLVAEGERMTWEELVALALSEAEDDPHPLTPREQEIADLVGQGLTNVEIAARLTISRRTVDSHLDHIKQKLGLRTRHQVIAWVLGRDG